jgi:RNA polymerase sigma-70 factor (ECF subfamily)
MTRLEFDNIILQNSRKLFLLAFRILNNRQEAEDAVQEVFLKMWTMQNRLDNYNDPAALAAVMTRNVCIDTLRRWKFQDPGVHYDLPAINKPIDSPQDLYIETETNLILTRIIDNLPQTYRDAVKMRDIQGLEYEEIADLTGMNINTLRVTISRARQMIREQYLKYTDERRKVSGTTK